MMIGNFGQALAGLFCCILCVLVLPPHDVVVRAEESVEIIRQNGKDFTLDLDKLDQVPGLWMSNAELSDSVAQKLVSRFHRLLLSQRLGTFLNLIRFGDQGRTTSDQVTDVLSKYLKSSPQHLAELVDIQEWKSFQQQQPNLKPLTSFANRLPMPMVRRSRSSSWLLP